jgi:hypothetical protein
MPSHSLMNRRTLLKGVGVALALPLLESMGWADRRDRHRGNQGVFGEWRFKSLRHYTCSVGDYE